MKKGIMILALLLVTAWVIVSCSTQSSTPTAMPPQSFHGVAKTWYSKCPPASYAESGYYHVGPAHEIELVDGRIVVSIEGGEVARLVWEKAEGQVQPTDIEPGRVLVLELGENGSTAVGILNCGSGLYVKTATEWEDFIPAVLLTPMPTPRPTLHTIPTMPRISTLPGSLLTPRAAIPRFPTISDRLLTPRPTLHCPTLHIPTPMPTFNIPEPILTLRVSTLRVPKPIPTLHIPTLSSP